MAAGLTVKKHNLDKFIKKMNTITNNQLINEIQAIINIDYELKLSEINSRFIKFLDYLEPFGPGNPKPIFSTKNIQELSNANLIGKNRDTIKFTIHGDEMNFEVIGFRMIENYEKIISGKSIDIAYTIEKNIWKNKTNLQFVLKDIVYSK